MIPRGSRFVEAARMRSGGWGATPVALAALFLLSFPPPPGAVSSASSESGDSGECAQVGFPTSPPSTILSLPPPLPQARTLSRSLAPALLDMFPHNPVSSHQGGCARGEVDSEGALDSAETRFGVVHFERGDCPCGLALKTYGEALPDLRCLFG